MPEGGKSDSHQHLAMKKKWVRECNGWWLIERTKSMLEKNIFSYVLTCIFLFFQCRVMPLKVCLRYLAHSAQGVVK